MQQTADLIPILSTVFIFLAVFLFSLGIWSYLASRKRHKEFITKVRQTGDHDRPNGNGAFISARLGFLNLLTSFGQLFRKKDSQEIGQVRRELLKGGLRKANHVYIYTAFRYLIAIALPVVFSIFAKLKPLTLKPYVMLGASICFALVGFYLPKLWLSRKISYRRTKMIQGLPDALDLMVVCVGAGMGLDAAIARVSEEMKMSNKIVHQEFHTMALELRAGKPREDALKDLALRNDLDDLTSLTTILIQTDRFGTSVSQALLVYSDSLRSARYQRAEELAAKLPVKLVVPLILLIFPAIFVVIVGPAAIKIVRAFF